MIGSLIVAAALMGQQPPARPTAARASAPAPAAARKLIEKRRAKKAAMAAYDARVGRELAAKEAKEKAEYEKRYKEMLPYLLEEQRQYLDRLSAMERNAALERMAGAAERQASASGRMADAAWWAAYRNR